MLGDELIAELRKAKLVKLHGQRERISIDELANMYPTTSIPLISSDAPAVAGYLPVYAPPMVGQAIAKLAGRKWHDATSELARRERRVQFEIRLADAATCVEVAELRTRYAGVNVGRAQTAPHNHSDGTSERWIIDPNETLCESLP